jgi:hypothetical protein
VTPYRARLAATEPERVARAVPRGLRLGAPLGSPLTLPLGLTLAGTCRVTHEDLRAHAEQAHAEQAQASGPVMGALVIPSEQGRGETTGRSYPSFPRFKAHQPRAVYLRPGDTLRVFGSSGQEGKTVRVWPLIVASEPLPEPSAPPAPLIVGDQEVPIPDQHGIEP